MAITVELKCYEHPEYDGTADRHKCKNCRLIYGLVAIGENVARFDNDAELIIQIKEQ